MSKKCSWIAVCEQDSGFREGHENVTMVQAVNLSMYPACS